MSEKYLPEAEVKDEQCMHNIHWEDCLLLLKAGRGEIHFALYKRDVQYFFRLLSYSFDSAIQKNEFEEVIKNILWQNGVMASRCKKVQIIVDNPLFTLVPNELYEEEKLPDYFSMLYGENGNWSLQTDEMQEMDAQLVYAVDNGLLNFAQNFQDFSITHEQAVLWRNIKEELKGEQAIYLSLHARHISFLVLSEKKPLLMQSYQIKTVLDGVYYLLNVVKTLDLKEDIPLFLTGFHKQSEAFVEKIKERFDSVVWLDRPSGGQFPDKIEQYPDHYFY